MNVPSEPVSAMTREAANPPVPLEDRQHLHSSADLETTIIMLHRPLGLAIEHKADIARAAQQREPASPNFLHRFLCNPLVRISPIPGCF
jgi:hypothetical protein